MLSDSHVKAAPARKNPGLLRHALPVAVHPIMAHVHVRRPGHRAEGEAPARAGALLLAVVAVAVLLRRQRQVAARVHLHALTVCLRARERRVSPAGQAKPAARVQRGLAVRQPVAFFTALRRVDAPAAPTCT